MPAVGAAIGAIASAVAGFFTATAIANAIIGTAISFGIAKIGSLISGTKKPASDFASSASSRTQVQRSSVATHKLIYGQVKVSGPLVYVGSTTNPDGNQENGFLHYVIALAAHECEAIDTVYVNDIPLTLNADGWATNPEFSGSNVPGFVRVRKHLGSPDQLADPDLVAEIPGWTENHRLRGITYIYVLLRGNRSIFPNGPPQVSAIVRGNNQIYDPRTQTTGYTNNTALCCRDYITNSRYGLGASDDEVDDATYIAAANTCDEDVTLRDGSTQKRYVCNGLIDTNDNPTDVLKAMGSAMAGNNIYTQGAFKCFPGAYASPSFAMDASWLAGPVQIQARPPRNELFNAVRGVFVDPEKNWLPTDFTMVTNATYETQDGGIQIPKDVEFAFTTHAETAQRHAKIILEKERQGIVFTAPCKMTAFQVGIMDTGTVTLAEPGWDAKIFRVIDWQYSTDGIVNLVMQEESAESYEWNAGEATLLDPAPDTNLPSLITVQPAGNPVVTEEKYVTTDGSGVKTRAVLSWSASNDYYLQKYIIDYKLASETAYNRAGETSTTAFTLSDLAPALYDFSVQAVNWRGVGSPLAVTRKEIVGLTDPPADITGFTVNTVAGNAHLSWDQATDLDVKIGGSIQVRWSPKTSGATWSNSFKIGEALSGTDTHTVVPLQSGTFLIKALDSVGNESDNATTILTNAADILNLNVVITADQHPAFDGAKTNMVVDGDDDTLTLDSLIAWDDLNPGDDIDDWDGLIDSAAGGGQATTGEYVYEYDGNDYIDFGEVYTGRITAYMDGLVYNIEATWDDYFPGTDIDGWPGMIDGEDITGTDAALYIQTTDDDPAGTPTWNDYRKFAVGDYTARAIRSKLVVTNMHDSNNIKISELSIQIDLPDRVESHPDEPISSGGTIVTWDKPFFAKPAVGLSIESASEGDTPTITHVTSGGKYTGATIQILNGGGVGRTVDVYARGY